MQTLKKISCQCQVQGRKSSRYTDTIIQKGELVKIRCQAEKDNQTSNLHLGVSASFGTELLSTSIYDRVLLIVCHFLHRCHLIVRPFLTVYSHRETQVCILDLTP